jgi:ADP-heptose:LPS heptosyltransferase
MKVPFYVHQTAVFALGNFVNCTPAIQWLSKKYEARIPVLFDTEYVRQCFLDCPFIEIIDVPRGKRLFGSELKAPKRSRYMDCEYIFRQVTGRRWTPEWHTYVDRPSSVDQYGPVVIINGSGSEREDYVASKDVGDAPYLAAEEVTGRTVFVGSGEDLRRNPWAGKKMPASTGNIRAALAWIAGAEAVIANDTGLAHAAGAMNKPLLVLWKNTPFPRCGNPGHRTQYAFDNHEQAVRDFLSTIQAASSTEQATALRIQKP